MYRIIAAFLSLIMICGLTVTAAASSYDTGVAKGDQDANSSADTAQPEETEATETTDALTPPYGSEYLAWALLCLDNSPELVYDSGVQKYFLSFGVSDATKLTSLMNDYRPSFALKKSLNELEKLNDVNYSVWDKPDWREQSIASQLSRQTVNLLKGLDGLDTYTALQFIKLRPEYQVNQVLREQVDYTLATLDADRRSVRSGLYGLMPAEHDTVTQSTMTPADTVSYANSYLAQHPELDILFDLYQLYLSGKTSNMQSTLLEFDAAEVRELYLQVKEATPCWADYYSRVDSLRLAVPCSEETAQYWLESIVYVA